MADDIIVSPTATYPVAADDVGGGVLAQIVKLAYSADGSRVLVQVDANGVLVNIASLPLPALAATSTIQATQQTSLTSLDTKTPALGQQLAAASSPVVLTAAQITTLTPLATVALGAGSAVIGHVIADTGSTTAVTGNVAITAAALPLPSGAATSSLQGSTVVTGSVAVTSAGLTNLDVALSTRTKPADQQHAILDSGTTTVTQATGTNLHVVVDSAPTTAVTGTFFQGTQPVSLATLPALVAGSASIGAVTAAAVKVTEPAYADATAQPQTLDSRGRLSVNLDDTRRVDELVLLTAQAAALAVLAGNYGYEVR